MVGIGLGEAVYVWNAESGGVTGLGEYVHESLIFRFEVLRSLLLRSRLIGFRLCSQSF